MLQLPKFLPPELALLAPMMGAGSSKKQSDTDTQASGPTSLNPKTLLPVSNLKSVPPPKATRRAIKAGNSIVGAILRLGRRSCGIGCTGIIVSDDVMNFETSVTR